jgi:hypothetical protein
MTESAQGFKHGLSISRRHLTYIYIFRPIVENSYIRSTGQATLTLAVRITVTLSLLTGATEGTIIVVTDRNRTFSGRSNTNIYLPVPSVICTNVVHTVQPSLTVFIPIAVPFPFSTGTAHRAVVRVAGVFITNVARILGQADINSGIPAVIRPYIADTNKIFCTIIVAIAVPFSFVAGTANSTIVIRSEKLGALLFRSRYTYIDVPGKSIFRSDLVGTDQSFCTFRI